MNRRTFQTASLEAYETIRDDIIDGIRKPGQRLVRRTLAAELGMSPIPIMEALLRLEQDGLVESVPMYGARVKELTIEGLINEQAFREAIECQAARCCAERATDRQLQELMDRAKPLDDLMASSSNDSKDGRIKHMEFHLLIARYSGFQLLESKLKSAGFMELMRVNWINAATFSVPDRWHQQLIEAIMIRDAPLAEAKMRQHVRYNRDKYIESLKAMLDHWEAGEARESDESPTHAAR
jgi:DNA-binding GntR family transcriptional regulator